MRFFMFSVVLAVLSLSATAKAQYNSGCENDRIIRERQARNDCEIERRQAENERIIRRQQIENDRIICEQQARNDYIIRRRQIENDRIICEQQAQNDYILERRQYCPPVVVYQSDDYYCRPRGFSFGLSIDRCGSSFQLETRNFSVGIRSDRRNRR